MKNTEYMQATVNSYQAKQFRIYLLENEMTFASWLRSEIDKCLSKKENGNGNKKNKNNKTT